mgnify:CR=1 FL=1
MGHRLRTALNRIDDLDQTEPSIRSSKIEPIQKKPASPKIWVGSAWFRSGRPDPSQY